MSNEIPSPIPASPAAPVETSLTSRLTNVFIAPGEVFAEVKTSPVRHSNWLVAGLIFILLSWCAAGVMLSQDSLQHQMTEAQEHAMQKQVDSGKMTQAQVDTALKIGRIFYTVVIFVGPVLGAAIGPFLGGFILWAGGALIFRKRFDYLKGVEAAGLTMVVAGLGALVKGLLCAAMGSMFVSVGAVLLVRPYDPTSLLHLFLLTFDIFAIWGLVLSGIALAKLSEVSFVKAFVWVSAVSVVVTGGFLTLGWAAQHLAPK